MSLEITEFDAVTDTQLEDDLASEEASLSATSQTQQPKRQSLSTLGEHTRPTAKSIGFLFFFCDLTAELHLSSFRQRLSSL